MILLDTDALSILLRPPVPTRLEELLHEVPPEAQFTSAINIGELVYGAHRGPHTQRHLDGLRTKVLPNVTVLPFDQEAALIYGRVRADLERKGRPIAEPDLCVAAITLAHRLTLVTGNVRHFERIPGLRVEDFRAARR